MRFSIRFACILAGCAAGPASLFAQIPAGGGAPPPAPAALSTNGLGPRMQFNTENHDAGTNLAGDTIQFAFVVTNTGDEMLLLSNVHASCGCTVIGSNAPPVPTSGGGIQPGTTTTWTHEIAPGQTGVIPLQIMTSGLRGSINKTVEVTSNDRTRPRVTLHVSAVVWLPIEVEPPMASFTVIPGVSNANSQVLRIFNRMESPLSLSDPQSSTNAFSAVLKTNVSGQEFELTIIADPLSLSHPSLGASLIQGQISMKSSATNKNPLTITVFETIYPEITVFPLNLQVPSGPLTQPSTSHLQIRGNAANITLSDPQVNAPGVEVAVKTLQTNRQYYLDIVFPAGFQAGTNQQVTLTVKTDNPHFPTITVPVIPVPRLLPPAGRVGGATPIRAPVPAAPPRTAQNPPGPQAAAAGPAAPPNPPAAPLPRPPARVPLPRASVTNFPPLPPDPAFPTNTLQP
ncbi:MAG TPA: DUF1573 domain-containing protein [Candidatus Acidoferrum sp.]|nr:DUF1573 domain-containing protein [Candidatus Acidoferrum sp.]